MTTSTRDRSTWITSIAYRNGYLALFTRRGTALLYGPSDARPDGVPAWVPGLLKIGRVKPSGEQVERWRRSVGRAYNRFIRGGGFAYQRVGRDKVSELREMMAR